MLNIYFLITRYSLVLILLFVLAFQTTLPTFQNKIYIQASFGEFIFENCKDKEHSHPPLSPREPSNDSEYFVNLDLNNSFFIFTDEPLNDFYTYSAKYSKQYIIYPKLLVEQLPPARGPPFFEV